MAGSGRQPSRSFTSEVRIMILGKIAQFFAFGSFVATLILASPRASSLFAQQGQNPNDGPVKVTCVAQNVGGKVPNWGTLPGQGWNYGTNAAGQLVAFTQVTLTWDCNNGNVSQCQVCLMWQVYAASSANGPWPTNPVATTVQLGPLADCGSTLNNSTQTATYGPVGGTSGIAPDYKMTISVSAASNGACSQDPTTYTILGSFTFPDEPNT